MNVDIKPLVWGEQSYGWSTASPFGRIDVYSDDLGATYIVSHGYGARRTMDFPTVDAAKLAAERQYTDRVLDCLMPADELSALQMLTLTDQCMGLYDSEVK